MLTELVCTEIEGLHESNSSIVPEFLHMAFNFYQTTLLCLVFLLQSICFPAFFLCSSFADLIFLPYCITFYCIVQFQKNPYPPHGRLSEIPRGRGVLKVKILEAKYEAKLESPGGQGCKTKPSLGGVWIFSETAHCIVLHCTVLHCVVLHCIVLYCIVLHCVVLHCIVLCCIALHCVVLHCIVLCCIALHCVVLHCIALCCIALYCIVLYCIALCCIALHCVVLY